MRQSNGFDLSANLREGSMMSTPKNKNSERTVESAILQRRTPATPKRLRSSIRLDAVNPQDFMKYNLPFACEDCTHFDRENESCTLGYNSRLHRRAEQYRTYCLNGKMALCRFLEID
jgi:hypothetical protein